jgi:hypothetical protein
VDQVSIAFQLRSLDEVKPWGDPDSGLYLQWYGLTDGWYDLRVGDHHIFEPAKGQGKGVPYYVARFWEDLVDVAPFALNPLPDELVRRVSHPDWRNWVVNAWEGAGDNLELVENALGWWGRRHVPSAYLRGAPRLDLWRDGHDLHVEWHSAERRPNDPAWSSPSGKGVVSAIQFREQLAELDRGLLAAMEQRIDKFARGWSHPEIKIDVEELRKEHATHTHALREALAVGSDLLPPWKEIVAAIAELEKRVPPRS